MPIVARLAGTCPVCEGVFKVTRVHRMVHHGYQRPGIGSIVGDCYGVGLQAYEISASGCEDFRDWSLDVIASNNRDIEELGSNPPPTISEYTKSTYSKPGYTTNYSRGEPKYATLLQSTIRQKEHRIIQAKSSVVRMNELIASWTKKPLLEIDEEGLTPELRRERDSKRDERATQKAQKEAERAARRERTQQREEAKEAEKFEFLRLLKILVTWEPGADRTLQSRRLNAQMVRKYPYGLPFEFHDPDVIGAEAARLLVELGLGEMEPSYSGRLIFRMNRAAIARGKPQIE